MTDNAWYWRVGRRALHCLANVWNRPHVIVALLSFIAIFYTYHDGNKQDRVIERNQREALDQFCRLAEQDHKTDVDRLTEIYTYLDALPRSQYDAPINQFVINSTLTTRETEAYNDKAPPLCDRPGLGLPEPDPVIPDRPADLRGPPFPEPPAKP